MDSDPDLEIIEKDSGMSSLGGSKDETPERRAVIVRTDLFSFLFLIVAVVVVATITQFDSAIAFGDIKNVFNLESIFNFNRKMLMTNQKPKIWLL